MKIFVSYTETDLPIAQALCRNINNAFRGKVHATYAKNFILPGDDWKKSIKINLRKCDAILVIITSRSVDRPWIYVEWSAFWLYGKKPLYCIADEEISLENIIDPIKERQLARMQDEGAIGSLLETISKDSGVDEIPFNYARAIVEDIASARQEIMMKTYLKFKSENTKLPLEDHEKYKISKTFAEDSDDAASIRVCSEIRDQSYKADLCVYYLDKGNVEAAGRILEMISSPGKLAEIASFLINQREFKSQILDDILSDLSRVNQAVYARVFRHAIQDRRHAEDIFNIFIERLDSLTEVRKIMCYLPDISEDRDDFMVILGDKFLGRNYAEMRKTISTLEEKVNPDTPYMRHLVEKLKEHAPVQYKNLRSTPPEPNVY